MDENFRKKIKQTVDFMVRLARINSEITIDVEDLADLELARESDFPADCKFRILEVDELFATRCYAKLGNMMIKLWDEHNRSKSNRN